MKKPKSMVNILYQNIIITLLFFIVIALVVNGLVTRQLYDGAIENGNVIAKSIANHIQERMQEPERDLLEIEQVLSEQVIPAEKVDQYLDGMLAENPFIMAIEIMDKQGSVINAAPFSLQSSGMDRSGELFYREIKEDGSFYWSKLFTFIMTGEPTIAVSNVREGKIYVIYLNVEEISRISLDYGKYFGNHIQLFITDENGTYISNANKAMIYQRAFDKDIQIVQATAESDEGYFETADEKQLVSVAYIENSCWYVSLYSSIDYVFSPIRNTYFLFYLFLFVLAVLSFVYYRKGKALSGIIDKFSGQTRHIGAGNFSIILDEQKFKELHNLKENFNLMIEELVKKDLRLEEFAYIDILTGLPNRRAMMKKLEEYVAANQPFAIVYFDLDQFKNINDSCGHFNGDIVLNLVAKRISACIEKEGMLARIGGDEFLYLTSTGAGETSLMRMLEGISQRISEPFHLESSKMYIGISSGIAFYPENADNVTDLLKFSDMAMYAAKNKGKNRFEFFTEKLKTEFDRKIEIESQLRSAIEKQEFSCVYQPQIEISSGDIIGFEALIRWNNAKLGNVSPEEFIGVAEERNLINDITFWMLKKSCEGILQINHKFRKELRLSVNVSALDLKNKDFLEKTLMILAETGMSPEILELEITENMLIDNYGEVIGILDILKKNGIRISLDDFGKGYSSLSYLNQLPIDTLKIDREFLTSASDVEKGKGLMETIIEMGKKMKFMVIAEGIETEDQLSMLREINCYGGQGYLMCRPVGLDKLFEYIENKENEGARNWND